MSSMIHGVCALQVQKGMEHGDVLLVGDKTDTENKLYPSPICHCMKQ